MFVRDHLNKIYSPPKYSPLSRRGVNCFNWNLFDTRIPLICISNFSTINSTKLKWATERRRSSFVRDYPSSSFFGGCRNRIVPVFRVGSFLRGKVPLAPTTMLFVARTEGHPIVRFCRAAPPRWHPFSVLPTDVFRNRGTWIQEGLIWYRRVTSWFIRKNFAQNRVCGVVPFARDLSQARYNQSLCNIERKSYLHIDKLSIQSQTQLKAILLSPKRNALITIRLPFRSADRLFTFDEIGSIWHFRGCTTDTRR